MSKSIGKWRKKPVVIDVEEITDRIKIETLEGTFYGTSNDVLITGVQGEKYPCNKNIFFETYEPADDEAEDYLTARYLDGTLAKSKENSDACKFARMMYEIKLKEAEQWLKVQDMSFVEARAEDEARKEERGGLSVFKVDIDEKE